MNISCILHLIQKIVKWCVFRQNSCCQKTYYRLEEEFTIVLTKDSYSLLHNYFQFHFLTSKIKWKVGFRNLKRYFLQVLVLAITMLHLTVWKSGCEINYKWLIHIFQICQPFLSMIEFFSAIDLINNLLQVKMRKRYSVDKTLSHPWLQVKIIRWIFSQSAELLNIYKISYYM